MTAYIAIAYEYAVEMTYPLPEGTKAGLLNLSAMVGRDHQELMSAAKRREGASNYCTLFVPSSVESHALNFG